MRFSIAIIVLCFPVAASAASRRGGKDLTNYQIEWIHSIEEGKIAARKYLRPIVLHFCPLPPHRLAFNEDASTFDTKEVKALAKDTVFVRLAPEIQVELENKYEIMEIPTIVLIDGKGKRLWKNIVGHCDWPDLVKAIKSAHAGNRPLNRKDCARLDRAWMLYEKYIAEKDYYKAIFALKSIDRVSRETWFHAEAAKALEKIDETAAEELEEAKKLIESDPDRAAKMLKGIAKSFKTRPAAEEAEKIRNELLKSEKIKPEEKEVKRQNARELFL
ncbi:MAG: hypothetical protein ACYS8W_20470, partial [Planctomycetota bacterium]